MSRTFASAPFGGAPLSTAALSLMDRIHVQRSNLGAEQDIPKLRGHDKWQILNALTEARDEYDLSDRAIAVLKALFSFHCKPVLQINDQLIVFPSNRVLSRRANGMPLATLRRHLASLVTAGLILRRDSPNGKRYARRDKTGSISAFGFDLGPFVLEAPRIYERAASIRADYLAAREARTSISLHRRDLLKAIAAAEAKGLEGDWTGFKHSFAELSSRVPQKAPLSVIIHRRDALAALWKDVEETLLQAISATKMSAIDAENERHRQTSNPESYIFERIKGSYHGADQLSCTSWKCDLETSSAIPASATFGELGLNLLGNEKTAPKDHSILDSSSVCLSGGARGRYNEEPLLGVSASAVSLDLVLSRCPDIQLYARHQIRSWQDLVATAKHVRKMLGISPDAWKKAVDQMGQMDAAITIAAILQRGERVTSAGGYLRKLTEQTLRGRFSVRTLVDGSKCVVRTR